MAKKITEKQIAQMAVDELYFQARRWCEKSYAEARKFYTMAADRGHCSAQYELAEMYHDGEGGEKDEEKERHYYHLAAAQGHKLAQEWVDRKWPSQEKLDACKQAAQNMDSKKALQFAERYNSELKYVEARIYYEIAAQAGHAQAQYRLAELYAEGRGGPEDIEKSERYYILAANQGHVNAQFDLAHRYSDIFAIFGKRYSDARKYFQMAADDQGYNGISRTAQNRLAAMCNDGEGGPRDVVMARKYYRLAADQGDTDSRDELWKMDGQVDERDIVKLIAKAEEYLQKKDRSMARCYYRQAADFGHKQAQYIYAEMLCKEGGLTNREEARRYYELAADQGHAEAPTWLGKIERQREQLKRAQQIIQMDSSQLFQLAEKYCKKDNYVDARFYFKCAADKGHVQAQYYLAKMCFDGLGGLKDFIMARKYYTLAAVQGDEKAFEWVEWKITVGIGRMTQPEIEQVFALAEKYFIQEDYGNARTLFTVVADQGNKDALYTLGTLYYEGKGGAQNFKMARHYFSLAACQGHACAQYLYGLMLAKGIWGYENLKAALRYFKMAADQGYTEAQEWVQKNQSIFNDLNK